MKTHNLKQGSSAWLAFRRAHFGASDAAAMLGISPYKRREVLLKEYTTRSVKSIGGLKHVLRGHQLEAQARRVAEEMIGEELFPLVGTWDEWDKLSASFDGLTKNRMTVWEHKSMNATIAAAGKYVPEYILAQIQQQLLISGATSALFMATSGKASEEPVCVWVKPDPAFQQRIIDGWDQFDHDLMRVEDRAREATLRTPSTC